MKKRRLTAAFLVLSMLFLLTAFPVQAISASQISSTQLSHAVTFLARYGIYVNEISDIVPQVDGLSFDIRSAHYVMTITQTGYTEFAVFEEDKKDVLVFDATRALLTINQKPLQQIAYVSEPTTVSPTSIGIQPRNSETYYTENCPYGTASDYTIKKQTKTQKEIVPEQKVRDYTTFALATILSGLTGTFWAGAGSSLCFKIAEDILGGTADGQVLAHESTYYWHKDGHTVPNFGGIREVDKIVNYFEGSDGGSSISINYKVKNYY